MAKFVISLLPESVHNRPAPSAASLEKVTLDGARMNRVQRTTQIDGRMAMVTNERARSKQNAHAHDAPMHACTCAHARHWCKPRMHARHSRRARALTGLTVACMQQWPPVATCTATRSTTCKHIATVHVARLACGGRQTAMAAAKQSWRPSGMTGHESTPGVL